jgi:hypothetical protein
MMTALWPFEQLLRRRAGEVESPSCFVIGPPRAGTSLFYELLVRRFHVAYLSNLGQLLPATPLAATAIGRSVITNWRGSFESRYGWIDGLGAPNEGGWLWDRWFPQDYYLDASYAERLPVSDIRRIVGGVCRTMGGPFVTKNVLHSVHMMMLDRVFPGCVFIELNRDPVDNVRSIVRARAEGRWVRPIRGWFSVKPRQWEPYGNATEVLQACAQVCYVHENIERDAHVLGSRRRLMVDYQRLCRDPRGVLKDVDRFFLTRGVKLRVKDEVPDSFVESRGRMLDDDTERQIQEGVASLWKRTEAARASSDHAE